MITIFATPRAFKGHIGVIQRNAILSWLRLNPRPQIVLLGSDPGTADIAAELGVDHVPAIECNSYGTPLVRSLFEKAEALAKYDMLCFINADIILTSEFLDRVRGVADQVPRAVMVGRRMDLAIPEPIDFTRAWEAALRQRVAAGKVRHRGIDYVVYPKGAYAEMPPFAIGRLFVDNWLLWYPNSKGVATVDLTRGFVAIHSFHDHGYDRHKHRMEYTGPEFRENQRLLASPFRMHTSDDTSWVLTPEGTVVKRRASLLQVARRVRIIALFYYYRKFAIFAHRHPIMLPALHTIRFVAKLPRRMRDRLVGLTSPGARAPPHS